MTTRTYTNQFNLTAHPCYIPQFILSTFMDTSWGNDACPSFLNKDYMLTVFVDFDNPEHRDFEYSKKYTVVEVYDIEELNLSDSILFETNDEFELEAFCIEHYMQNTITELKSVLANFIVTLKELKPTETTNFRINVAETILEIFVTTMAINKN